MITIFVFILFYTFLTNGNYNWLLNLRLNVDPLKVITNVLMTVGMEQYNKMYIVLR